jgi:hypothetical protein
MSWEFTEDAAFLALCDAYKESGEPSAMEFLAHGEGASIFRNSPRTPPAKAST